METSRESIACPGCGKRFAWKPQYAGRKVGCACGRTFIASPPGSGVQPAEDEYDLAPEPEAPVKPASAGVGRRVAPVMAGPDAQPPPPAPGAHPQGISAYPGRIRRAAEVDDEFSPFREIHLPILLMALGLIIWVACLLMSDGAVGSKPLAHQAGLMVCTMILCIATMLAGVAIAARILGINFGSIGLTILKLASIALLAGAVFSAAAGMDHSRYSITGMAIGYNLAIIIYWWLFSVFFKLELQENLLTVGIVIILQSVGGLLLYSI